MKKAGSSSDDDSSSNGSSHEKETEAATPQHQQEEHGAQPGPERGQTPVKAQGVAAANADPDDDATSYERRWAEMYQRLVAYKEVSSATLVAQEVTRKEILRREEISG